MLIYSKTLFLWVVVLSVQSSYGFFRVGYQYLKEFDSVNVDANITAVSARWISQPLDHLNSDYRSWKMRYFENLEFHSPGGPILLFIGGEGAASGAYLTGGLIASFAKEVKGAMFLSEHRFYGESVPNDDISVENLAHLSSFQALNDIRKLLEFLKSQTKFKNSKVIVFGGSYPGNLAAWIRLWNPDIVDAALSSSSPVLAKADFYEFLEVVGDSINRYGSRDCYNKIAKTFERYEELLKTTQGIKQLIKEDNICYNVDMTLQENQFIFYSKKINRYAGLVQYGTPEAIKMFCWKAAESSINDTVIDYIWNDELQCNDYDFNRMIQYYKRASNDKAWYYQMCTEFGYMMTTTSSNKHPFPKHSLPIEMYYKMCTDLFGPEFDQKRLEEGVQRTNSVYGGRTPQVDKVVFVNGDMDPWHTLGVLKSLSKDTPAITITAASHCTDLMSDDKDDYPQRVTARNFVKRKLKKWIGSKYE